MLDKAYENFVAAAISMVTTARDGQPLRTAQIENMRRASYALTQAARDVERVFRDKEESPGAYERQRDRGGVDIPFPRNVEFYYDDTVPKINFHWIPPLRQLPENRTAIRSDPYYIREDTRRMTGPRYTGNVTESFYDVWPATIPTAGMAQVHRMSDDESWSDEDDGDDESEDMEEVSDTSSSLNLCIDTPRQTPESYGLPPSMATGGGSSKRKMDIDIFDTPSGKRARISVT